MPTKTEAERRYREHYDSLPNCDCGRKVTQKGCAGCERHPLDCACFPVGYDHDLAKETQGKHGN